MIEKSRLNRAQLPSIVVLAKYYPPYKGGIEASTCVFCESLAEDYSVHVIAFNHQPGYRLDLLNGVIVERFPVQMVIKSQPISVRYLWAAICRRADIVHFHAPNVLASLAILFRSQRRLIAIHHMDIFGRPVLRKIARYLYNYVLLRSNALVVTSAKNANISADIQVLTTISVIPLGIEPDLYHVTPAIREEGRRWRTQIAQGQPVVGFVGRHARYKGLDVLIRALVRLTEVHAVIAGDGPYRKDAEALAEELDIGDRVHFIGEISHSDKIKMLSMIDVFAFPSTESTEAFGLSQLEAMVVGVPVVSSALPTGVTDISIDGETAITFPPGDAEALADALERVMSDADLRAHLIPTAYAALTEKFTVANMAFSFRTLNNRVASEPRVPTAE